MMSTYSEVAIFRSVKLVVVLSNQMINISVCLFRQLFHSAHPSPSFATEEDVSRPCFCLYVYFLPGA